MEIHGNHRYLHTLLRTLTKYSTAHYILSCKSRDIKGKGEIKDHWTRFPRTDPFFSFCSPFSFHNSRQRKGWFNPPPPQEPWSPLKNSAWGKRNKRTYGRHRLQLQFSFFFFFYCPLFATCTYHSQVTNPIFRRGKILWETFFFFFCPQYYFQLVFSFGFSSTALQIIIVIFFFNFLSFSHIVLSPLLFLSFPFTSLFCPFSSPPSSPPLFSPLNTLLGVVYPSILHLRHRPSYRWWCSTVCSEVVLTLLVLIFRSPIFLFPRPAFRGRFCWLGYIDRLLPWIFFNLSPHEFYLEVSRLQFSTVLLWICSYNSSLAGIISLSKSSSQKLFR